MISTTAKSVLIAGILILYSQSLPSCAAQGIGPIGFAIKYPANMISNTATAILTAGILILYIGYKLALPKPLLGIPHNPQSAKRLMGDVPGLLAEVARTGDFVAWLRDRNVKSKSVISQIFIRPFGRPIVVLTDYRESWDIQMNRGKEFDRSSHIIEIFRPLTNTNQFGLKTGPEWKLHRRLVQDTMSQTFLHEVAAPSIYASSLRFIDLWNTKALIANGRPFSAMAGLHHATFDAVLAFTFGSEFPHSATKPQAEGMQLVSPEDYISTVSDHEPVEFPHFDLDESLSSILNLANEMEKVIDTPSPRLKWLFIKCTASFRRSRKLMDDCFKLQIEKAVTRHKQSMTSIAQAWVHSTVDHIIDREEKLAQKEKREPDFFSTIIQDEFQGIVIAGHDTTSGAMCWTVKLLAEHPIVQSRIRASLRSAYGAAVSEKRIPSIREITETSVPYLDAAIEEILRVSGPVPLGSREATQDTVVLGYAIPKGTTVMYLQNGPSFLMPAGEIDEGRRSDRSQEDQKNKRHKAWNDDDIAAFKPERWLVESRVDDDGNGKAEGGSLDKPGAIVFDSNAGPTNSFGLGLRSCFGRRLAYLELRIMLIMLIWKFELLECPKEISGWHGRLGVVYKPQQCFVRLRRNEC